MDVRECESCGKKDYAGGRVSRRTIEYVLGDEEGTILSAEWSLCVNCAERARFNRTCPFCLSPIHVDEDPRDCPDAPDDIAPDAA